MATIRRKNGKYQVQVRRKGHPTVSRTFVRRADAAAWARETESQLERQGLPTNSMALARLTVADILVRYRQEIVPSKRGAVREAKAIKFLLQNRLSDTRLDQLTAVQVASYRDHRLKTCKGSTVNRELAIFRHAWEVARKEWNIPIRENPFKQSLGPRTPSLVPGG